MSGATLATLVALLAITCRMVGVEAVVGQFRGTSPCSSGSFACKSGSVDCILLSERCNGRNDCTDGSDELDCTSRRPSCELPNFRCANGNCLDETRPCNGIRDCLDGADENMTLCATRSCAPGFFRCTSDFRCIESHLVCDGRSNCFDGSDEQQDCPENTNLCNDPGAFNCSSFCILSEDVCNGIEDCDDGRDEQNCAERSQSISCGTTQVVCSRSRQCVDRSDLCNGVEDCELGEDEENCERQTSRPTIVIEPCENPDEFRCGPNGACLPSDVRCDGSADCYNGFDEQNCPARNVSAPTCGAEEFMCRTVGTEAPRCVQMARRCDKFNDCPLGDDESDCEPVINSPVDGIDPNPEFVCDKATQFLCVSSSTCIDKGARCNSVNDCPNGEDEQGCQLDVQRDPCSPTNLGSCEQLCVPVQSSGNTTRQRYSCGCLTGFRLAGPYACADVDECASGTSHCSQRCENSPGSFRCYCVDQYSLDPLDQRTCRASGDKMLFVLFRDELRELRLARLPNQAIERAYEMNSASSRLVSDGASKNASLAQLAKHVELLATSVTSDRQLMRNISFAAAFDFDVTLHLVFWASQSRGSRRNAGIYMTNWEIQALISRQEEQMRRRISDMVQERLAPGGLDTDAANEPVSEKMKRLKQAESTQKEIVTFMKQLQANASQSIPRNLSVTLYEDRAAKIEALAFDWLNRLIYWTDSYYKRIGVVSQLNGRWRSVIDEQLESPRALALDPEHGTMYFSDCSENNAFIHSAGMDGSDRVPILDSRHVSWPNGLTVDYASRRLYYVDAKLVYIGSCSLDVAPNLIGSTCNRLYSEAGAAQPGQSLFYSISTFEDHLFWADNRRGTVRTCNRFACNSTLRTLVGNRNDVHAISIAHVLRQPNAGTSGGYCLAVGQQCPFMCLPTRLDRSSNSPSAKCVCDVGETFIAGVGMLTGRCVADPSYISRKPSDSLAPSDPTAVARDEPVETGAALSEEPNDVGRVAIIVICTLLGVVLIAVLVAVLVYRNYAKRNVKSMNFDNPVYRRTTATQHFFTTVGGNAVVNLSTNNYDGEADAEASGAKRNEQASHSHADVSVDGATNSARYASPSRRLAGTSTDPNETRRLTSAQATSADA